MGQKLPMLQIKNVVEPLVNFAFLFFDETVITKAQEGGGQKTPILRRHSLWTDP